MCLSVFIQTWCLSGSFPRTGSCVYTLLPQWGCGGINMSRSSPIYLTVFILQGFYKHMKSQEWYSPLSKIFKPNESLSDKCGAECVGILQGRCLFQKELGSSKLRRRNCPPIRGSSACRGLLKEFVLCTSLPVPLSPEECLGSLFVVGFSARAFLLTAS